MRPPPTPACDRTSLANRSALAEAPASPAIRTLIPSVAPPKTRKSAESHRRPRSWRCIALVSVCPCLAYSTKATARCWRPGTFAVTFVRQTLTKATLCPRSHRKYERKVREQNDAQCTSAEVPRPSKNGRCDTPLSRSDDPTSLTAHPIVPPPPLPAQSRRPSREAPAANPHATSCCVRTGGVRLPWILGFACLPSSVVPPDAQLPYRKLHRSGVFIQGVLISALHVFRTYLRHQRPPTGMRNGLLKAPVRTQKYSELLAPSTRSLPYFRIQAHTTRAAFATVTMAVVMPLPHHSGVPHST